MRRGAPLYAACIWQVVLLLSPLLRVAGPGKNAQAYPASLRQGRSGCCAAQAIATCKPAKASGRHRICSRLSTHAALIDGKLIRRLLCSAETGTGSCSGLGTCHMIVTQHLHSVHLGQAVLAVRAPAEACRSALTLAFGIQVESDASRRQLRKKMAQTLEAIALFGESHCSPEQVHSSKCGARKSRWGPELCIETTDDQDAANHLKAMLVAHLNCCSASGRHLLRTAGTPKFSVSNEQSLLRRLLVCCACSLYVTTL